MFPLFIFMLLYLVSCYSPSPRSRSVSRWSSTTCRRKRSRSTSSRKRCCSSNRTKARKLERLKSDRHFRASRTVGASAKWRSGGEARNYFYFQSLVRSIRVKYFRKICDCFTFTFSTRVDFNLSRAKVFLVYVIVFPEKLFSLSSDIT